ncbi:DsbA family protein [Yersinia enterocolitica]|uniref:DsbA family protein n=1 Tax=Yersinia enterocolitica TaxID=630 RepID=UPI0005E3BCBA|nr:DsbA family protein [Yersinia enterocolitica]MBW5835496.1 DsbA family protein [Yersinia enterocolitica]CNL75362.1 protein disulfide isomerase I [Yersinia enterocolitica]
MLRFFLIVFLCFFSCCSIALQIKEGKQYTQLSETTPDVPKIVEFFSFYCSACMQLSNVYGVSQAVEKVLPQGDKLEKYHIGSIGPMGEELTKAWSIAKLLDVEDHVEQKMYDSVQKARIINSPQDIRQVFIQVGVKAEDYDAAYQSFMVKSLTEQQRKAAEALRVNGVPSFYVMGKYRIRNNGMQSTTIDSYGKEFAEVVRFLLEQCNN